MMTNVKFQKINNLVLTTKMQSGTRKIPDPNNGWSDDIEYVLDSIRHNAAVMSDYHKKNYAYYSGQLKYYKIPVIIISGLNSVTAVGLQPYVAQQHISVTNCLLALLCGIIGSIELFLGISAGAEAELKASKEFYLLSIDIYMTLSLDRQRRPMAKTYLDHKYSEYADLFRGSALIQNKKLTDKLSDVKLVCNNKVMGSTPTFSDISSETISDLSEDVSIGTVPTPALTDCPIHLEYATSTLDIGTDPVPELMAPIHPEFVNTLELATVDAVPQVDNIV
jgi:hypothetical protein